MQYQQLDLKKNIAKFWIQSLRMASLQEVNGFSAQHHLFTGRILVCEELNTSSNAHEKSVMGKQASWIH